MSTIIRATLLTFAQVNEKAKLLCSCYSLLENIINHMISEPSLDLDEKQTSQLYTAMVGALGGVMHFLDDVKSHYEDQVNFYVYCLRSFIRNLFLSWKLRNRFQVIFYKYIEFHRFHC